MRSMCGAAAHCQGSVKSSSSSACSACPLCPCRERNKPATTPTTFFTSTFLSNAGAIADSAVQKSRRLMLPRVVANWKSKGTAAPLPDFSAFFTTSAGRQAWSRLDTASFNKAARCSRSLIAATCCFTRYACRLRSWSNKRRRCSTASIPEKGRSVTMEQVDDVHLETIARTTFPERPEHEEHDGVKAGDGQITDGRITSCSSYDGGQCDAGEQDRDRQDDRRDHHPDQGGRHLGRPLGQ